MIIASPSIASESPRLSAESLPDRVSVTFVFEGAMPPPANDPLGQPAMGGPAERSCAARNLVLKVEEHFAHDATAGGTMGERRPNEAFAGGVEERILR